MTDEILVVVDSFYVAFQNICDMILFVVMQLALILVLQSDFTPEFSAMSIGKRGANPGLGWAFRRAAANVRKQCS